MAVVWLLQRVAPPSDSRAVVRILRDAKPLAMFALAAGLSAGLFPLSPARPARSTDNMKGRGGWGGGGGGFLPFFPSTTKQREKEALFPDNIKRRKRPYSLTK